MRDVYNRGAGDDYSSRSDDPGKSRYFRPRNDPFDYQREIDRAESAASQYEEIVRKYAQGLGISDAHSLSLQELLAEVRKKNDALIVQLTPGRILEHNKSKKRYTIAKKPASGKRDLFYFVEARELPTSKPIYIEFVAIEKGKFTLLPNEGTPLEPTSPTPAELSAQIRRALIQAFKNELVDIDDLEPYVPALVRTITAWKVPATPEAITALVEQKVEQIRGKLMRRK